MSDRIKGSKSPRINGEHNKWHYNGKTVGYKNDLNNYAITCPLNITSSDLNILNFLMYAIKTKLKRHKRLKATQYSIKDIYEAAYNNHSNYTRNIARLDNSLRASLGNQNESATVKLSQVSFSRIDKQGFITTIPLFSKISYDKNKILTVKFNPDCYEYFTNLNYQSTFYSLKSLLKLRNKYSKILFMHLSQFRSSGCYEVGLQDLLNYFNISNIQQSRLINKVLRNAIKELLPYFPGLHLTIYLRKNKIRVPIMLNPKGILTNISYFTFSFKPRLKIGYSTKNKAIINVPKSVLINETSILPTSNGIRVTDKQLPFKF